MSVNLDEIEGVFNLAFRFPGLTVTSSEWSFLVFVPCFLSKEAVEALDGVGGIGDSGRGRSSKEKIERSSPFH